MNLFNLLLLSSFLFLEPTPSHGKEISTCDCNKPIFVGLLDTSEPHFCNKPSYNDIKEVLYEVISKNEPPLRNAGYLCRQWLRQKTITGYFFGAYDTTYQETPLLVTVQECAKMAVYETCSGNKLQFIGNSASFNNPPKGDGSWMTTQVHTIMNCELERFNVTQDCTTCPIKSPFGILNSNSNSNITHYHKGHLTFIWNKPVAKPTHCVYTVVRQGRGLLYDSSNSTIQHLRDAKNQLEFIINGKPETICKFDHSFKVKGIAETYIRYSRAPTTVINKTSATSIPSEFGYNLSSSFLVNDRTGLCVGKPNNNTKELRGVNCASIDADNYMFIQNRIIPKHDQHLCVTASPSFNNIIYSNCQTSLSSRQLWKYNSTSGTLSVHDNTTQNNNANQYCLALDIFSYQNQQFNNVTPTLIDCTEKYETDYLEWKFMEKEIFLSDEPAFIDEASHHQYTSGSLIDISNQLNDEIRNVYCESLKTKQFLAMSMAQSSPMLAGIILGLPTCQRVQADGQTMLLQQCKKLTVNVKAQKTKCGWEPKFHHYTIGKDGFTRTKFRPCTWSNGLANLNGQPHEYFNGTWKPIRPNVKISSIGLKNHFDEEVDIEAKYLHNLETSFHSKEIEQMNMIGELMAVMRHDEINPISPILSQSQEKSRFNFSFNWLTNFFSATSFIFLITAFALIYFCLKRRQNSSPIEQINVMLNPNDSNVAIPIRRATWSIPTNEHPTSTTPRPTPISLHSHPLATTTLLSHASDLLAHSQLPTNSNETTIDETTLNCSNSPPPITPQPLHLSPICLAIPSPSVSDISSLTIPALAPITPDIDIAISHNHTTPKLLLGRRLSSVYLPRPRITPYTTNPKYSNIMETRSRLNKTTIIQLQDPKLKMKCIVSLLQPVTDFGGTQSTAWLRLRPCNSDSIPELHPGHLNYINHLRRLEKREKEADAGHRSSTSAEDLFVLP
ncbi:hypothetical protein OUZ56_033453 [Daphnia magna]|uniref:Ricin B lectin domain-containing protein n=1 Tax=Daphnia magna TaxID=35525 RepID=A0ABR0BAR8_9CRUS|nr:hypothetical protein OUZ56_033453 [Daphnia magna]